MLSDIMFLPSYQETFGLVIVEAAGSGLPLLLRDIQVYTTIFDDCYLKASDNEKFVDYINRLSKDKDLYCEMSCKARKLFEKYSSSRAGINLLNIYSKYYYKKFGKKLF
jgi:1,2-diacylglycerol-3-alpha-glucose alpha-1,2-galactosyltransferase